MVYQNFEKGKYSDGEPDTCAFLPLFLWKQVESSAVNMTAELTEL